ncbi:transposon-transfer assisting family protein [Listeria grandensis]|uniref:transposon-transfer assisting family protein n=1 Tax=Listeria grandensis TaxID=1494963 RepID=UPI00164E7D75|nr:transposon-transfer assisting family protein [Listeria grandensis]MBC6314053.1 hypothetical protein [Listeria grandensis]
MDLFTIEEQQLMCIFDMSSKERLLADLEAALPYIYNKELMDIMNGIIGKLNSISDAVFGALPFDFTDYYSEEIW